MNFATSISHCCSNYAGFAGRATRSEYWFFALFMFGVSLAAILIDGRLGMAEGGFFYFGSILALILPSIAVTIRRLHDLGRSGWWCFIGVIPFVGSIILLIWFCQRGTDGDNLYGADPLEVFDPPY
jgi:uncharacterized membrane protein YhaH (DUF805 family)